MPSAWGFGHSYAWALRRASQDRKFKPGGYDINFPAELVGSRQFSGGVVVKTLDGEIIPNPIFSALPTPSRGADQVLLSCLFGNGHFQICSSEHPDPFDIVHPKASGRIKGARRSLSGRAVTEAFKRNDGSMILLFKCLKRHGFNRIIHFQSPPPPEDLPPEFVSRVHEAGGTIPSPELILRAWFCQDDASRELCKDADVTYFEIPSDALTARGFLRAEFCRDGMHGTHEFGRLLLERALEVA